MIHTKIVQKKQNNKMLAFVGQIAPYVVHACSKLSGTNTLTFSSECQNVISKN